MNLSDLDKWMKREGIMDVHLARYLGVTKACISQWRSRGRIGFPQMFKLKSIYMKRHSELLRMGFFGTVK